MDLRKYQKKKYHINVLSLIILDSVIFAYEKYHPQTFLEECKYVKENIKTKNYIDEESKSDSDTDSDTGSDNYGDNDIDIEE